jgi:hypothetical protein
MTEKERAEFRDLVARLKLTEGERDTALRDLKTFERVLEDRNDLRVRNRRHVVENLQFRARLARSSARASELAHELKATKKELRETRRDLSRLEKRVDTLLRVGKAA